MRKPPHFRIAAAGALALIPLLAFAQEPPAKADVPPPPRLEKLEEGEPPTITIKPPSSQNRITEKRDAGGEVQEIKVKSGPSTYYLKPRKGTGRTPADDLVVPQWVVHEFDGKIKKEDDKSAPQVLEPAPGKSDSKKP